MGRNVKKCYINFEFQAVEKDERENYGIILTNKARERNGYFFSARADGTHSVLLEFLFFIILWNVSITNIKTRIRK